MRKLASIQKIKDLKPISGADRIELAMVLGWQVVVGKGQFQKGELIVYYEIDSFLPIKEEYSFLKDRSYKKSELLGEGYRLKTMQMRGEISQGLIMPISDVLPSGYYQEGQDVTELLGVREWQIPVKASSGGTIIGEASGKIHVTDETRIQSAPELLNEFKGLDYYITLKMDGSSHSVKLDKEGKIHVFGHNYEYADDRKSSFYEYVKKHHVEENMKEYMRINNLDSLTVQGEWCAPGIQNNRLGLKEPEWFIFTVDENDKRCGLNELLSVAEALKLKHVPVLESGHNLPEKYDEDGLLKRAGIDNTHSYLNDVPEGIVIRPVEPVYSPTLKGPLSMKVINNNYLLKSGS